MRNYTLLCALLPALILAMCQAETKSARLTAFGKTPNQNNHKNNNNKSLGTKTRECKTNTDCGGIQNTTCMHDFRDNKMRCLCSDSSAPINGACPNLPRALHATCTADGQCSQGLFCKPMNGTSQTKICMCKEEIEHNLPCSGTFSISKSTLLSIIVMNILVLFISHCQTKFNVANRPF